MSDHVESMEEEPITALSRHTPERSTVARRCREYFLRRLERTENMKRRWSLSNVKTVEELNSVKTSSTPDIIESVERERTSLPDISDRQDIDSVNEKKWKSSLDLAMNCLRQEISSLISQDNDLFRQLLTLHDSITELRDRHNSFLVTALTEERDSRSPSLESLSDTEVQMFSPSSTLSSCSSHNSTEQSGTTFHSAGSRRSSSSGRDSRSGSTCLRCRTGSKGAPPHRHRAISFVNLYTVDNVDPYDSGIHLQGCHSDSDHEIFV